MTGRFDRMTKLPPGSAARFMAEANMHLSVTLDAPASAPVARVLEELDAKQILADQFLLLAAALPARERVWWACLAARDLPPGPSGQPSPSLVAAEAWVFKPSDQNRAAARIALDHARPDDETTHCALAVLYCDGTLGPGDLAHHQAPAGAAAMSAFAMNMVTLGQHQGDVMAYAARLVDRAVDIARGGNGRLGAGA